MQSIIRINGPNGIDPQTGSKADKNSVQTLFVRLPLHSTLWQAYLSVRNINQQILKNFFVDCNICYGFNNGDKIQPGLQTVIILNCKFKSDDGAVNYNGANPQIHIETIDDSCRTFTAAEKAAGRSVTELTIKVLCEQLKIIQIPETEKLELINGFIQRRNTPNEEVLAALCASGFDYSDFAQKNGIKDEQIIIELAKQNLDYVEFAQKKGITDEQILVALVKNNVDCSDLMQKKEWNNDRFQLF
ncbi:Hypothetical_protein [Hexamita inflata]|uniref:Hypothetical_protein n=1 Tax=Hexamita inflata TaxID=28002 RepID=A0AA86U1L6_9EUKA|nr:Hypothetical protein HINF_LOCUS24346 [Hexamita inflata]CAI9952498.1 Hypothetical protein HINF_LOCUS40143 [Hexamita inflata]